MPLPFRWSDAVLWDRRFQFYELAREVLFGAFACGWVSARRTGAVGIVPDFFVQRGSREIPAVPPGMNVVQWLLNGYDMQSGMDYYWQRTYLMTVNWDHEARWQHHFLPSGLRPDCDGCDYSCDVD